MTNVIRLNPASHIPTMLRALANEIEAGEQPRSVFALTVDDRLEFDFYGWGDDLSVPEIIGLLAMAQQRFLSEVVDPNRG